MEQKLQLQVRFYFLKEEANLPLISYQHGTLTNLEEAPSNYGGDEIKYLAPIISSAGYAISVPDYIGYGASDSYPHPYEHAETLGSASFDMLMAAKEFFDYIDITLSDKLFITGYSEGGNATMALHQHIEKNSDLTVTMSAPAAGAYNKTAFATELMERDEDLTFLPKFMWVLYSYNWIYGLNRPWSDYVVEPYATTLEAVTDPMKLGDADISLNPQTLCYRNH
jgi:pimeloyl-ACP methyl ester carboxylesterase